jgi:hypothetical protein
VDRRIAAPKVNFRGSSETPITVGEGVTVIGYPLGLPVKVADGGTVRSLSGAFFVANLNTYARNSGSAVYNTARLLTGDLFVEGILTRGETDFARTSPCFISKRCPTNGCRGEDVTFAHKMEPVFSP